MTRNGKTTESQGNAMEEEILEQLRERQRAIGLKIDPEQTIEQWLAIRRAAGLKIDPETAEVTWIYAQTVDPYGVYPEPPDEWWQVGREYFARSPGSDIWVNFGDLPEKTRDALWEKHKSRLAFPAGVEFLLSRKDEDH